ncbi:MAG: hypothetical protein K2F79_03820, partial [Muribaculaceae bacterium]|nr:hypothetical protein [Muribaculaceae bacterium]
MVAFAASSLTPIYAAGELTQVRYNPDPEKELTSVSRIQLQLLEANSGLSGHVAASGITFRRKNGSEICY